MFSWFSQGAEILPSGEGHEHVTVNESQKYRQGTQLDPVSVLGEMESVAPEIFSNKYSAE